MPLYLPTPFAKPKPASCGFRFSGGVKRSDIWWSASGTSGSGSSSSVCSAWPNNDGTTAWGCLGIGNLYASSMDNQGFYISCAAIGVAYGNYRSGGGYVVCAKTDTNSLIKAYDAGTGWGEIDIWDALNRSLWSSSLAISVYVSGNGGTTTLGAAPGEGNGDPRVTLAGVSCPTVASCTGGTLKTVTVYDDGRITIT